ncbi:MAG TPA: SCE4755 family polysaccharide monooxygenase-like protein [Candidatus Acidoferrales bacterium]|nr:SCE4755 family polysaccharide monooxygenase-like protein [Candidatus Acidoferrales bacterium]
MLRFKTKSTRLPMIRCILLLSVAGVFVPVGARAHFILVEPDAWMSQDAVGLPEKVGPCGNEGGGTPTGKVTAFQPGQTIAVTIDEVIMHPGHYRVALAANDRGELPPEPVVTRKGNDPCGSVAIEDLPSFPILADNVLPHTQAFDAPQTFMVTLPSDVTCTKCTLQILEFMSNHSAPCFYHHCADISIQPPAETATPTPPPSAMLTPTDAPSKTPTSTEIPTRTQTALSAPEPSPTSTLLPTTCIGDCSGIHMVQIVDLVTLVNIALGDAQAETCPHGVGEEADVTIDLIIQAVNHALNGCG